MNEKTLNNLAYLYISIPIIIFLSGWCKPLIAIPIISLIVLSIIYRIKNTPRIDILKYLKKNKKAIIITFLIAAIYVYLSGIGGYVYQNSDHLYRNAVFKELVNNPWPIYHKPQGIFNTDTIFVYYFALWLPSALIAKITNIEVGYFILYIWCLLGVVLTFCYIKKYYKGKSFIPLILFIFFSGLDIVERFLLGKDNLLDMTTMPIHLEWIGAFQMSSFTTQIFWVFNQAIPAWIITFFMLKEEDNRYIGVILAMSLIFCTLPAAGLVFIFIYKIFFATLLSKKKKDIKEWLTHTFSWQNILIGIPILIINYLFLKSNLSGNKISFGINEEQYLNVLIIYIYEFGIYYLLTYKYIDNKPLYWISFISLLICPLIQIGHSQDFCMRACIPSQIIMFTLVLETLCKTRKENKFIFIILCITLSLGMFTPFNEIQRTIKSTNSTTHRKYINLSNSYNSNNFYGNKENNIFVKYISK